MEIGKPQRVRRVEPLVQPVPRAPRLPAPQELPREPVKTPVK